MEQTNDKRPKHVATWEGRDEMNLAEFPIACLSSRPGKATKTLQFEDRIWDSGRSAWTTRRLTISASDKFGLPTALDDEVILGLIQLTREAEFDSRKVFFSRYRLIRLLGWRNEGKSYARLETSLKRWVGVTLYYENAWWDKEKQSWVDESFHILERVSLLDRRRKRRDAQAEEPALSMFSWNEVVFRSFQSGYLKSIDMDLFRRLEGPVAKRLYRLLDKRFYHKRGWRFDLRELACEHVGLSRSYDTAGLKRKLRPAIAELESVGYLKAADGEKRFVRLARGRWQVRFQRNGKRQQRPKRIDNATDAEAMLTARGVNRATANRLAADHPAEDIRKYVEALDRLLGQGRGQPPRNPAGFLVQAIRDGYALPEILPEPEARLPVVSSQKPGGRHCRRRRKTDELPTAREKRVNHYLKTLTPERQRRLEENAIASADPLLAARYESAIAEGEQLLIDVYRRLILERHVADNEMAKHCGQNRRS